MPDIWRWVRRARSLAKYSGLTTRSRSGADQEDFGFPSFTESVPQAGEDSSRLDTLTLAAWELVQAFDELLAAMTEAYDHPHGLGKDWWMRPYWTRYGRGLKSYCEKAKDSGDRWHQQLAAVCEGRYVEGFRVARTLKNEFRPEPRLETQSATPWVAEISPRMGTAKTRPMRSYTSVICLEVRERMPQPAILCVDVSTDVDYANVSLTLKTALWRKTDVTWKESRIWLIVYEPRLQEEDRIEISVTSSKLIAEYASVRIGSVLQHLELIHASA
jgi:hypothetical protein